MILEGDADGGVEGCVAKLGSGGPWLWPFITTCCEALHCGNRAFGLA
jgi:hypothetical protein